MSFESLTLQSRSVKTTSNGVFGELLQGVGSNNQAFLITSPVNIFSQAYFTFDPTIQGIKIKDLNKYKSQDLANRVYEKYKLQTGGVISIQTEFPVGKGLGSSSADLVATAKALSAAYSLNLSPQEIEDIIRGIEPTDGVMYPGIVSYYYKEVKLNKLLGKIDAAMILGVDEGGEVDTIEYNKISRNYTTSVKQLYDHLHIGIENAVKDNNISLLGQIATQSGRLNQQFNPKKLFSEFVKISEKLELPGVIVAHSGTYLGFLLDKRQPSLQSKFAQLKKIIFDLGYNSELFNM